MSSGGGIDVVVLAMFACQHQVLSGYHVSGTGYLDMASSLSMDP